MPMIMLNNGSEFAESIVITTMITLEHLWNNNPVAFIELVAKARNPDHKMFGNTSEIASRFVLTDLNGKVYKHVKEILLSAVHGEGLAMTFGNPVVPRVMPSTAASLQSNPITSSLESVTQAIINKSTTLNATTSIDTAEVLEAKNFVDVSLASKTLSFLSNNKYKVLFVVALTSYGIYDYYHDKHISKAISVIKNGLFSQRQSKSKVERDQSASQDPVNEGEYNLEFSGLI